MPGTTIFLRGKLFVRTFRFYIFNYSSKITCVLATSHIIQRHITNTIIGPLPSPIILLPCNKQCEQLNVSTFTHFSIYICLCTHSYMTMVSPPSGSFLSITENFCYFRLLNIHFSSSWICYPIFLWETLPLVPSLSVHAVQVGLASPQSSRDVCMIQA